MIHKAFGYIRVSTSAQVKEGYSLGDQSQEIESYCHKEGYQLLKIYEDAGISGAKVDEDVLTIERPGIQNLLADLRGSGVTIVVVLNTGRLWRSDIVKVLIQLELKRNNADIKAIDQPNYTIYNKDPSEFLVNGMMELLDQYQRLEISMKLRRGRNRKATLGGYAGGAAALGYKNERDSKVLYVNEQKVATVQRVFELKTNNPTWSLQQIADQLNSEGHTTRNNKLFQKAQVKRTLDRVKLYTGIYKYSGIEVTGQHQAIVNNENH